MKKKIGIFFIVSLIFCLAPLSAYAEDYLLSDQNETQLYLLKPDQNVTAYTASKYRGDGKLRYTASGDLPRKGYVAMKQTTVNTSTPFGTIVTTPQHITNYEGATLDTYNVKDTGIDPSLSSHAIDIWWGFCRTDAYNKSDLNLGCSTEDAAYKSALKWGNQKMTLEFYN
ncbi:hypothetical protein [Sporosarcina sp. Te-1]|uniref:hypothetical protein n=1 Tax=Sporosarcina sp. Te-1 TaxID=2818390 RepID=UPI001A9E4B76|nr:hypothetical protein [Sporosarcina sp. Te-1]QTD42627.1 hypothetical protein J3U78_07445 [Sporosarcina sp. Te-1]